MRCSATLALLPLAAMGNGMAAFARAGGRGSRKAPAKPEDKEQEQNEADQSMDSERWTQAQQPVGDKNILQKAQGSIDHFKRHLLQRARSRPCAHNAHDTVLRSAAYSPSAWGGGKVFR
jgi:hypothetical protein